MDFILHSTLTDNDDFKVIHSTSVYESHEKTFSLRFENSHNTEHNCPVALQRPIGSRVL